MPVVIRLSRKGGKKNPFYHVVALNKVTRRDGQALEKLGSYSPKTKDSKEKVKLDLEAIQKWRDKGAQVSETVGQLLKIAAK